MAGSFIAGIKISIAQSRVHFVQVVPWRPTFAHCPSVSGFHLVPNNLTVGMSAQVSVAILVLANLQFVHDIVGPFLAYGVPRGSVGHGECAEVVSGHMPVQPGPVGEKFRFQWQSRFLEERCQQAVGVILQQDLDVQVAGVFERAVKQVHFLQRKFLHLAFPLGRNHGKTSAQKQECEQKEFCFHDKYCSLIY